MLLYIFPWISFIVQLSEYFLIFEDSGNSFRAVLRSFNSNSSVTLTHERHKLDQSCSTLKGYSCTYGDRNNLWKMKWIMKRYLLVKLLSFVFTIVSVSRNVVIEWREYVFCLEDRSVISIQFRSKGHLDILKWRTWKRHWNTAFTVNTFPVVLQ